MNIHKTNLSVSHYSPIDLEDEDLPLLVSELREEIAIERSKEEVFKSKFFHIEDAEEKISLNVQNFDVSPRLLNSSVETLDGLIEVVRYAKEQEALDTFYKVLCGSELRGYEESTFDLYRSMGEAFSRWRHSVKLYACDYDVVEKDQLNQLYRQMNTLVPTYLKRRDDGDAELKGVPHMFYIEKKICQQISRAINKIESHIEVLEQGLSHGNLE